MENLRWKELAKALFFAGFFGYLAVAIFGALWVGFIAFAGFGWLFYEFGRKIAMAKWIFSREFRWEFGGIMEKVASFAGKVKAFSTGIKIGRKITTITAPFVVYAFMKEFYGSFP